MPRKSVYRAVADIDREALAEFQAGIRKRYTDEQILAELKQSAERLGRSPTMREFAADSKTTVHPQTVIEHFGSWNRAKRKAGLVPRRFATREELLALLSYIALGLNFSAVYSGEGGFLSPHEIGLHLGSINADGATRLTTKLATAVAALEEERQHTDES